MTMVSTNKRSIRIKLLHYFTQLRKVIPTFFTYLFLASAIVTVGFFKPVLDQYIGVSASYYFFLGLLTLYTWFYNIFIGALGVSMVMGIYLYPFLATQTPPHIELVFQTCSFLITIAFIETGKRKLSQYSTDTQEKALLFSSIVTKNPNPLALVDEEGNCTYISASVRGMFA